MRVLLVFTPRGSGVRVMVHLKEKRMQERVISLLESNRGREAFDLLKTRAEVEAFFPLGVRPEIKPEATLIEDML